MIGLFIILVFVATAVAVIGFLCVGIMLIVQKITLNKDKVSKTLAESNLKSRIKSAQDKENDRLAREHIKEVEVWAKEMAKKKKDREKRILKQAVMRNKLLGRIETKRIKNKELH